MATKKAGEFCRRFALMVADKELAANQHKECESIISSGYARVNIQSKHLR
jgi:hypothetical protein